MIALDQGALTVRRMTNTHDTNCDAFDPSATGFPPILDLEDVCSYFKIGKTKALDHVACPGFPDSVVEGMHRYSLAAIRIWEVGGESTCAAAEPKPPVLVSPPAAGKPGRPRSANRTISRRGAAPRRAA